jgi:FkbM family methyltransferase
MHRAIGLARSLVVYHAIPWRQRRLRRLYSGFVSPGDLVFDVGAHVGNRARAFAALGCRVVALEPQPDVAGILRRLFARAPLVTIVEAAVTERVGRIALAVSDRTPTVTTTVERWRQARAGEPGFGGVKWNCQIDVEATTLDRLIGQFGAPAFVKIDVEGAEPAVFAGLSSAVPALSFEYLPNALDDVELVVARLATLGTYRFNWSPGETYRLAFDNWCDGASLIAALRLPVNQRQSGDVYARLAIPALHVRSPK